MTTEDVKAFKLCVKVLEVDGMALGPDGNLPFCMANLRLIFPDEFSTTNPDSVPAVCPGQAVQFNGVELKYSVQVRHLVCECEALGAHGHHRKMHLRCALTQYCCQLALTRY